MIGGLKKTTSRFAVAAAAGLFLGGISVSPATAADLGGDCCADLEERVAELEATTVRKGNRRVSVTLSGQVSRVLIYWDDGDEANVYETDNTNSSTRINLTGSATIRPGWTAGFRFVYELEGTDSAAVNQLDDDGGVNGDQVFEIREANWWLRSDQLGQLTVGRHQPATDNIVLLDLGGAVGGHNDITTMGGGFFLRNANIAGTAGLITGTRINEFAPGLDTARREGVMYTTPTFGGARILASWGEDDTWDVGLWVTKEWNSVRFIGAIGYLEDRDEEGGCDDGSNVATRIATCDNTVATIQNRLNANVFDDGDIDIEEIKGSASIQHVPSGLFLTGAFSNRQYNGTDADMLRQDGTGRNRPDMNWYYVSAGVRKRWNSLGQTSIFGEWSVAEDGITGRREAGVGAGNIVSDSELEMWGIGFNQGIDNAAMQVFVGWRHFEFDVDRTTNAGVALAPIPLEDFDIIFAGGRIQF